MAKDMSLYESFGIIDPIIHDFSNKTYKQDFIDKLYSVFVDFLDVYISNHSKHRLPIFRVLPDDYHKVSIEEVMDMYYIRKPYGYNMFNDAPECAEFADKDSNILRMDVTFFRECVSFLRMVQNDNTNPLKLYNKRLSIIYKSYWNDVRRSRWNNSKSLIKDDLISTFDKGFRIQERLEYNPHDTRYYLEWTDFSNLLFEKLSMAWDRDENSNLYLKLNDHNNVIQILIKEWITHLYKYKDHPDLNTRKLDEESRLLKERN